jgi:MoaA/NifB/PqqE/SkfB family radical SAM enzyme
MLQRILRTLRRGPADVVPPAPTPTFAARAADLLDALDAARPVMPAGFAGTVPPRWFDETHNVSTIRAWIEAQRAADPDFDATGFLRAFADAEPGRAAPLIVLAQECQAAGHRAAAVEAISAAMSCNHWDLHAQRVALEIFASAGDRPDQAAAGDPSSQAAETEAYLRGRFCAAPFETLETTPNGDAYVCCPSWLPVPIGNIGQQAAGEIWHSPIAAELRRSILDGSFRYCSRMHCTAIGNRQLPGRDAPEAVAAEAAARGAVPATSGPRHVILSHDRSCNLACPSCRRDFYLADKQEQAALDRVMDDFVMPVLRQADSVRITGSGDPFGSNHFRRVLKHITRDAFPRLRVDLHTNAQLWNERAWTELGLAGLVRVAEISIDAARPETYAVVRRGGDFARLLDNLGFVRTLRQAGEIEHLCLSFVVQSANFREMPDFVQLARHFAADSIQFNMIRNWGTYPRDEFQHHLIGSRAHPEHAEFRDVLRSPLLADPIVVIGNVLGYAA